MNNRLLLILKYLWDKSDENNPATISHIIQYLSQHNMTADRKTVTRYIDTLIDFGIDIIKVRKTQNQYFIGTRHFEAPEVKLLIDAVQSARFITKRKSKDLINKLAAFVAPNQAFVLKRHLYIDSRNKANNEAIYIISDNIQSAIIDKKKIRFQYFDYGIDGKPILRHEGMQYLVSPYDLIWSSDTYYLAGFHETKDMVTKFRVDRIKNLEITDVGAVPKPAGYSVAKFFSHEFSMMGGEECEVTLLCENVLMNSVIDRFGKNKSLVPVNDNHFAVTVTVDLSNTFYSWVFVSEGRMKILSPDKAIEGFRDILLKFQ